MSLTRTFAVLIASIVTLSVGGAGLGYAIGRYIPDYYRSVFANGHEPHFDPISVGVGLGATQGLGAGVIVGLITIAIFFWRESRVHGVVRESRERNVSYQHRTRVPLCMFVVVASLLVLGVCAVVSFFAGMAVEQISSYRRQYQKELAVVEPILESDEAFSKIILEEQSHGGVYIHGEVDSLNDLAQLRQQVIEAISRSRVEESFYVVVSHSALDDDGL